MIEFPFPSPELAACYRARGGWRDGSPLDDLRRWRDERPDATAMISATADAGVRPVTWREYAGFVERFAGAFRELGVEPGDVVAVQIPSWWQCSALLLACARVGAVCAPVMTTIRPRELERILRRLDARVCVTVDRWAGFEHSAAVAEMAPRLPALRHRVILGATVADDEISFSEFFEHTSWAARHPMALEDARVDPDRVVLALFTSGTSGEPKGVLHTFNTLHAGVGQVVGEESIGPNDVIFIPHALTHLAGIFHNVLIPLFSGATAVLLDLWDGKAGLKLLAETGVTIFVGAPTFLFGLIAAAGEQPDPLPTLRLAISGATTVPGQLVDEVARVFGLPLRTVWAMTEVVGYTWTRADDPQDWGKHSDGRPGPGSEIQLRGGGEISRENPAALFVRGAGVCLATLGRDSGNLRVLAEHDDGWYDTGDLAVPDGRGGIRIIGRASDRIGGTFMIPANDVETELLGHPAVDDIALVGYPDGEGGELACAVVVARTQQPTLAQLREYLTGRKMTEWYQPTRLELVGELPRNDNGKVRKELLSRWLRGEAGLTGD